MPIANIDFWPGWTHISAFPPSNDGRRHLVYRTAVREHFSPRDSLPRATTPKPQGTIADNHRLTPETVRSILPRLRAEWEQAFVVVAYAKLASISQNTA
jgi:hypothetical protein